MRVFAVTGISKSGKTTTIERVIAELCRRGLSVGSIKDIHFEKFAIDTEGSNTWRHRQAGSELVTAWGLHETDLLWPSKLPLQQILSFYNQDFVVVEGYAEGPVPKIITAHNLAELEQRMDDLVFAISGRVADEIAEYKGIPAISAVSHPERLVDLILDKVFDRLPSFPGECCQVCGVTCEQLAARILRGEAEVKDCLVQHGAAKVQLTVGGQPIPMVPFVQSILFNAVQGVVKELDGYKPGAKVEIKIESI